MAKIVAVANQKGGVGKTTTAVNLSSCVAALGKKVLIVDLDPQGNTTTGYGISKRSVDIGTYEILIGEADARQAVRKTEFRTDVIGSNTRLAGASLEMIDLPGRESRLRKALAPIQKDYDFIFIDCPPNGRVMDEAADCSDLIVVPTTTGPADMVKTFETTDTLGARGFLFAILLTHVLPGTLSLKQSLGELADRDTSYFDYQIPSREGLKNFFGNSFGDDLYGYEKVYEQIKQSIKEDKEAYGAN